MFWQKLLVFCVTLTLAYYAREVACDASACPKDFEQVGDKCLYVDQQWKTWFEADRKCRSLNAGLLSIKNSTELKIFNDYLQEVAQYTLEFWTSGNSLGKQDDYFWQNTGEQIRYYKWSAGQPNTTKGDCITLSADYDYNPNEVVMGDYEMSLTNCTTWAPFICEVQPTQYQTFMCLNASAYYEAKVPIA